MSKKPFLVPNVPSSFKDLDEIRSVFKQFQSFADSINKQKDSGYNYVEVTASPYTVKSSDDIIVVNMAGACTVNIPALSIMGDGFEFMVIRAGAGAVTIDADGSENINGATTYSLATQWDSVHLSNDGSKWVVISNNKYVAPTSVATQTETNEGTDDTKIVSPLKLHNHPAFNRKNVLINGDFRIWQRGTSFAAAASGSYSADRWRLLTSGDQVLTMSQSTDVPAGTTIYSPYSLKALVTTGDATVAATQFLGISQGIEGWNANKLYGRKCVASFWIKSSVTGTYCLSLRNGAFDRMYVAEFTISSANTWEFKEIPIDFSGSTSAGTWDVTTGVGLWFDIVLQCGSNYYVSGTGAWKTEGEYASSNQVNFAETTNNALYLFQIQLEVGEAATEFEILSFAEELFLCQRYFEKSFNIGTAPAHGAASSSFAMVALDTEKLRCGLVMFKATKRTAPTMTYYRPNIAGTDGKWFAFTGSWTEVTSVSDLAIFEEGFSVELAKTTTFTAFHGYYALGEWTASAEF